MEFVPPVQSLPLGYLSFLGIKNGGANPSPMSQQLVSVVDLFQFYQAGQEQTLGSDLLSFAVGGGAVDSTFYVVPAGKVWYMREYVATSGTLGATVGTIAYPYVKDDAGLIRAIGAVQNAGIATGSSIALSIRGIWMRPRWKMGVAYGGNAAQSTVAFSAVGSFSEMQQ